MLIGALSFVMQVCCGISMKNSRRSTFTVCCTTGTSRMMPGPAAPFVTRPKVKTTRRSYCRTIWMVLAIRNRMTSRTMTRIARVTGLSNIRISLIGGRSGGTCRLDEELQALDLQDAERRACSDWLPLTASRPGLARSIGDTRRSDERPGHGVATHQAPNRHRDRLLPAHAHQRSDQAVEVDQRERQDQTDENRADLDPNRLLAGRHARPQRRGAQDE